MKYIWVTMLVCSSACATTGARSRSGVGLLVGTQTESAEVTANVQGSKSGKACSHSVLGLATFGDSSVRKASKEGGISKVAAVDHEYFNLLGLYGRVCTLINGE